MRNKDAFKSHQIRGDCFEPQHVQSPRLVFATESNYDVSGSHCILSCLLRCQSLSLPLSDLIIAVNRNLSGSAKQETHPCLYHPLTRQGKESLTHYV